MTRHSLLCWLPQAGVTSLSCLGPFHPLLSGSLDGLLPLAGTHSAPRRLLAREPPGLIEETSGIFPWFSGKVSLS